MFSRCWTLVLIGSSLLVALSAAQAAPTVTMIQRNVGAFNALDFFYSSSPGAEFTNYRLIVESTNGHWIQDPNRPASSDVGGDAVDTWMNTVYSLLGLGLASYNFNTYRPTGLGPENPPVRRIDWSVFDTGAGDTNMFDLGGGNIASAPYHLARVLVSPEAYGTAEFRAFDTLSNGEPTTFSSTFGIPEPSTAVLLGLAALSIGGQVRRRNPTSLSADSPTTFHVTI